MFFVWLVMFLLVLCAGLSGALPCCLHLLHHIDADPHISPSAPPVLCSLTRQNSRNHETLSHSSRCKDRHCTARGPSHSWTEPLLPAARTDRVSTADCSNDRELPPSTPPHSYEHSGAPAMASYLPLLWTGPDHPGLPLVHQEARKAELTSNCAFVLVF